MPPQLILVGLPGSGKSTVGAILAARLGADLLDTDRLVERAAGQPVMEIFVDRGEAEFRGLESDAVREALAADGAVVALGGGAVGSAAVRDLLATAAAPVVWLRLPAGEAARRSGLSGPRPLLLGNVHGRMAELARERDGWYRQLCTLEVDAGNGSAGAVATRVLAALSHEQLEAP